MPEVTSTTAGFSPWSAAAQGAAGLLSTGIGLIQRGQANRWLKRNPEPIESMPSEVKRNQAIAEIRANTGMPSEQYNNAMKNIQRQQLLALRRAQGLGGGSGLSIIGALNQQGNDAVGNVDDQDAAIRIDNEGKLISVNNNVANWKSQLFDRNVRQRWLRQFNQRMGELTAGNLNTVSGVDKLFAAGGQYGASGGFKGRLKGTTTAGYAPDFDDYNQPQ